MTPQTVAFILTILVWWLSTGVLIMVCARSRQNYPLSIVAAALVLAGAVYGLVTSAWDPAPTGAYVAFLSALGVWGCIEMTFLLGLVTGPRTQPCPTGVSGWERFRLALQTLIYHELMIAAAALAIVALTWGAPNQTGTFAFLILMAMRISAKLNIFLGVPNLTDEFLPQRLGYLKSYFRKREVNLLFPVTVGAATVVAIHLAQSALGADGAEAASFALLFALTALAILEHLFMIVPLPDAVLWRWAMPAAASKPNDDRGA